MQLSVRKNQENYPKLLLSVLFKWPSYLILLQVELGPPNKNLYQ